jgi:alkanesulfonate monooxygenase SsuD/methylene tetrahydromethanopterin reductase-like flavin-dependent oxidoreductase (luciferase family)
MGNYSEGSPAPVVGSMEDIAAHLAALADAGAAHLQLVLDPITTATIELVGDALADLRRHS